jgi:hypothetical protein
LTRVCGSGGGGGGLEGMVESGMSDGIVAN